MDNQSNNHVIKLVDRKSIIVSGVKRIINFDNNEFNLESIMGDITIKGNELEMIKLDTIDGNVSIKGSIDSICYSVSNRDKESLINKLFK